MIEMTDIDPITKLDDIIALIKHYDPQIITEKPELIEIKLVSGYGEELWIAIDEEFTVFFGDWHAHYSDNIKAYEAFITDLFGILENKKFIVCAYKNDKWCGSFLSGSETPDEDELREVYGKDKVIRCRYWDSTRNVVFSD